MQWFRFFTSHLPQRPLWPGPNHSCCLRGWWEDFQPVVCASVLCGAQQLNQNLNGRWRSKQWRKHSPLSDSHHNKMGLPFPSQRHKDRLLNFSEWDARHSKSSTIRQTLYFYWILRYNNISQISWFNFTHYIHAGVCSVQLPAQPMVDYNYEQKKIEHMVSGSL